MKITFTNVKTGEVLGSTNEHIDMEIFKHINKVNVKGNYGEVDDFILHIDNLGVSNHIECQVQLLKRNDNGGN